MIKISLRNKIYAVSLSIFSLVLIGCAALGTKTVYKAQDFGFTKLTRIGFSQIVNEDALNRIRPNTSTLFESAFKKYFQGKPYTVEVYRLSKLYSLDSADTSEIQQLCSDHSLDAYICTQIRYKFVNNTYMFIPLGKSEDAYVEMKMFNRKGELAIQTKHNTSAGNSYMMPPKAEQTIEDGTFGALKRIFKEIDKSRNQ